MEKRKVGVLYAVNSVKLYPSSDVKEKCTQVLKIFQSTSLFKINYVGAIANCLSYNRMKKGGSGINKRY